MSFAEGGRWWARDCCLARDVLDPDCLVVVVRRAREHWKTVKILITMVPMVPVFLILFGFGLWSSRDETVARGPGPGSSPSQNLTRVVSIAPARSDSELVLSELCRLARREAALHHESLRAADGARAPLTHEERFVLRVLTDRVNVLRAHRSAQPEADRFLLDVEALDAIRQRDEQTRTLRSVPQPNTVA